MSESDNVVSEIPKWITMIVGVASVVATMAVAYGSVQSRIDSIADRQVEHTYAIDEIEKKIVLVDKELVRDRLTIEYIESSITKLNRQAEELISLNREVIRMGMDNKNRENQK